MLCRTPREGIPAVLTSPSECAAAARELANHPGPIAVDTERAQTFRFDDRIFLLQLRKAGAGTFLIAPERHRCAVSELLAPVLNDATWILHSARNDLPMLRAMGWYPATLIDTELASRFLGLPKSNLSASLDHFLSITLAKGHGRENWSRWPLPESWRAYAALDVEFLLELAECQQRDLRAAGRLEWWKEECAHILRHCDAVLPEPQWQDTKGVSTLRSPAHLASARELWLTRRSVAAEYDLPEFKLLSADTLIALARQRSVSRRELARIIRGQARRHNLPQAAVSDLEARVYVAMGRAAQLPPQRQPQSARRARAEGVRGLGVSPRDPFFRTLRSETSAALHTLAKKQGLDRGMLIDSKALHHLCAQAASSGPYDRAELDLACSELGLRRWQYELVAPVLDSVLCGSANY